MQYSLKFHVLSVCFLRSLGDIALVQTKVKEVPLPTPATTSTTTGSTYVGTTSCTLHGDSHLHGLDDSEESPASLGRASVLGTRIMGSIADFLNANNAFDGHPFYLDVGDFWLIKSEMLSIQGRYVPSAVLKQGGAVVGAIALGGPAFDGKRLIIEPRNGSLLWDGHALSLGSFQAHLSYGDVTVLNCEVEVQSLRPFSQVIIRLPMGTDLLVNRYDAFLNVKITIVKDGLLSSTNVEGQCGNSNSVIQGSIVLPQFSLFD